MCHVLGSSRPVVGSLTWGQSKCNALPHCNALELAHQTIFMKNYPNIQNPSVAPGIEANVPLENIKNHLSFGQIRLLRLEVKDKYKSIPAILIMIVIIFIISCGYQIQRG